MKPRLTDYLAHMREAAETACSYIEPLDKGQFVSDKRTQQAVIFNLIVIGEAAAKISTEYADFVSSHPALPWKGMTGMRNRAAHGYFNIDLDIVWDTVKTALPNLQQLLIALGEPLSAADADRV